MQHETELGINTGSRLSSHEARCAHEQRDVSEASNSHVIH